MLSRSGIDKGLLFQYTLEHMTSSDQSDIQFVLTEIKSLRLLSEVWLELVKKCLLVYYNNVIIEFLYNNCEHFDEYLDHKKIDIMKELFTITQTLHPMKNIYNLLNVELKDEYMMNKRSEARLWRVLDKSKTPIRYLCEISQCYPELEYTDIRLLCYMVSRTV